MSFLIRFDVKGLIVFANFLIINFFEIPNWLLGSGKKSKFGYFLVQFYV